MKKEYLDDNKKKTTPPLIEQYFPSAKVTGSEKIKGKKTPIVVHETPVIAQPSKPEVRTRKAINRYISTGQFIKKELKDGTIVQQEVLVPEKKTVKHVITKLEEPNIRVEQPEIVISRQSKQYREACKAVAEQWHDEKNGEYSTKDKVITYGAPILGAVIGTFILPGLGSLIGGFIGTVAMIVGKIAAKSDAVRRLSHSDAVKKEVDKRIRQEAEGYQHPPVGEKWFWDKVCEKRPKASEQPTESPEVSEKSVTETEKSDSKSTATSSLSSSSSPRGLKHATLTPEASLKLKYLDWFCDGADGEVRRPTADGSNRPRAEYGVKKILGIWSIYRDKRNFQFDVPPTKTPTK